ncbi:MAG: response regulator [Ruminococcaceae bacterium]|nr:response regulator [Oscillospiraceae bacterium]
MKTDTDKRRKGLLVITSAILIVFILLFILSAVNSYRGLDKSIMDERVSSLEEKTAAFSSRIEMLRDSHLESVTKMANVLAYADVSTFEEVQLLYKNDGEKMLFATESGEYINTSGEKKNIYSNEFFVECRQSAVAKSSFISITLMGDYWAFYIAPENEIVIEGEKIESVILLVSSEEYASVAAIPLYNDLGATYVVDGEGFILIRPEGEEERIFNGINALSSLSSDGVDEETLAGFNSALLDLSGIYQFSVKINDTEWLIQNISMTNGRNIVVTLPISVTAHETFRFMSRTILLFSLVVLFVIILLVVWVLYFFKRDQEIRVEGAKMVAKSDFMSKISHDIRTPLNAVIGLNQLALDSEDDRDAVHEYLIKGKSASEYLLSLINDVLDMAKIESGKMTVAKSRFSMKELLERTRSMNENIAKKNDISLSIKYDSEITTDFEGDELRIQQCLMNLISNAVKFTTRGGQVELIYFEDRVSDKRADISITVKDSGIGMSEEFMARLFRPFEQERSSRLGDSAGSGLGLSIVHSLTEIMGGTVTAQSIPEKGSAFTIHIPLKPLIKDDAAKIKANESVSTDRLKGKRVLIAEDSEINRAVIGRLLEKNGLIVDEVENGKLAVDKFKSSRKEKYSVIILDIHMPIMDGLEAARQIRALDREDAKTVAIVALSANAYQDDVEKSLAAGMNAHLSKPVDIYAVKKTLNECISKKENNTDE